MMTITQSQSVGPGGNNNLIAVGSYYTDGTAAAFTITCGFRPRYVKVSNYTGIASMEWYEGMTDTTGIKRTASTYSAASSLGITDNANGFTVGLDVDVNVTVEYIYWIAIG